VIDVVEIMKHWYAGLNLSEIAHGLGLDRKTLRKWVAARSGKAWFPAVRP
jgi:transposase-like protein